MQLDNPTRKGINVSSPLTHARHSQHTRACRGLRPVSVRMNSSGHGADNQLQAEGTSLFSHLPPASAGTTVVLNQQHSSRRRTVATTIPLPVQTACFCYCGSVRSAWMPMMMAFRAITVAKKRSMLCGTSGKIFSGRISLILVMAELRTQSLCFDLSLL